MTRRCQPRHRPLHRPPRPPQRGAALLLAMIIVTLVATLAAGMVWQQTRAVQVEAAERAALQSEQILSGALDWARLILREDQRSGGPDHLGEPWATPLAEARLSTFLAAEGQSGDDGPEAFLSGSIADAQARFNLRNLVGEDGAPQPAAIAGLQRICEAAGVSGDVATRIADGLRQAWGAAGPGGGDDAAGAADVPLEPRRIAQLTWLGLDAETAARLEPWVVILRVATPVNVNTAPREVIAAAVEGLDVGSAERLVQRRQREPFRSLEEVKAELPEALQQGLTGKMLSVRSDYFEITGRLRLEDRVLEERSLVRRSGAQGGLDVTVLQRERRHLAAGGS